MNYVENQFRYNNNMYRHATEDFRGVENIIIDTSSTSGTSSEDREEGGQQ